MRYNILFLNESYVTAVRVVCGIKSVLFQLRSTACYFQGIQYLVDNDLLEWQPEAVAEFLYKEEGLNKTAIGNFLGERYDDGDILRQILPVALI